MSSNNDNILLDEMEKIVNVMEHFLNDSLSLLPFRGRVDYLQLTNEQIDILGKQNRDLQANIQHISFKNDLYQKKIQMLHVRINILWLKCLLA